MRLLLLGAVASLLMACGQTNVIKTPPPKWEGQSEAYLIGVGDRLSIQVWKSPELSVDVPVRPDGQISVPLAGDVQAEGQEAEALADSITTQLNQYIRNPEVTVIVTGPASAEFLHRVRVTGAVAGPQSMAFKKGITVLDMVLVAGGLTPFANGNNAILYRKVGNEVKSYSIRLNDILEKGKLETNYELAPADIITVPAKAF